MPDLSLIPTKALRDELLARCDHGVIVLLREAEVSADTISVYRTWKGNTHTCVGLALDISTMLLGQLERRSEHGGEWEEGGPDAGPGG